MSLIFFETVESTEREDTRQTTARVSSQVVNTGLKKRDTRKSNALPRNKVDLKLKERIPRIQKKKF